MANERQIAIRMTVDATSVSAEVPKAAREFERLGATAETASQRTTRVLARVSASVLDVVKHAAGIQLVAGGVAAIGNAITSLPRRGFEFAREVETAQLGMAGVLGSMTAINGRQTSWNQGLAIARDMVSQLNDDALRTAASSQELVGVFQAILAPGLAARMTLEQIRELAVVGTNATKAMGLAQNQVVQELRDLVQGGITPASSTLATALGLKDEDIARAKASSEGLFAFLMRRLQGFKAASDAYGNTLGGTFAQLEEGATRAAAEGMKPLIDEIKRTVTQAQGLFIVKDALGQMRLNPETVAAMRDLADLAASGVRGLAELTRVAIEHRGAIATVVQAHLALKGAQFVAAGVQQIQASSRALVEQAQAARLVRVEQATGTAQDAQAAATSRQKVAVMLAELQAQRATHQAAAAAAVARLAEQQAIARSIVEVRAEVVAKMTAVRATIAQAEAQIAAARAAGAQSFALATLRQGEQALAVAQAQHVALTTELAALGRRQAAVTAEITAATAAQTTATNAATAAGTRLAAAQGAAAVASGVAATAARGFGLVLSALGGPVGVAILALSALAFKYLAVRDAAEKAREAKEAFDRINAANAAGQQADAEDLFAGQDQVRADRKRQRELERQIRDAEARFNDPVDAVGMGASAETVLTERQAALDALRAKLSEVSAEVKKNEQALASQSQAAQKAGQDNGELSLTVEGTRQAWLKANGEVTTATSIQEEYSRALQASKNAYTQYVEVLKKSGAGEGVLSAAARQQAENEKALAAKRDKDLKSLNSVGAKLSDAQSKLDIERIRVTAAATQTAYANGQRVLEAMHAAGLVDERVYTAERIRLIDEQAQAQIAALAAENEALARRKLSGQEALDRDREIAENARKMAELQAEATAQQVVLTIQATAAERARLAGMLALRQAAQDAYDDQVRQQDRDRAGFGQGERQRSFNAGVSQIEDRYSNQRRDLANQRAQLEMQQGRALTAQQAEEYDKRLAIINEFQAKAVESFRLHYQQLGVLESDWSLGAREAMRNYQDDATNAAEQSRNIVTNALQAMEDGFVQLAMTGKLNFKSLVDSIIAEIIRAQVRIAISGILQWIGGLGGGATGFTPGEASTVGMTVAKGAAFGGGGVKAFEKGAAFTNSIVTAPTFFRFARGSKFGLMGEAGPEAVVPLARSSSGHLGVRSIGGGEAPPVQLKVDVHNNSRNEVSVEQGPDGGLQVFVDEVVSEVDRRMAGGGSTARAAAGRFGLNNGATLRRRRG